MRRRALIVLLVMVVGLVIVGAVTYLLTPRVIAQLPVAAPPATTVVPATPSADAGPRALILIEQADGNLAIYDDQHVLAPLTTDADGRGHIYSYGTPAPDGRSVAFVETVHGPTDVTSSLVVQSVGGDRRVIFGSTSLHPFYLNWSPDSRQLAVLAQNGPTMRLLHVGLAGGQHTVIDGDPSYFAWTADSHRLILHTRGEAPDGTIGLWSIGDDHATALTMQPAFFRAPVWLPDGRSALATIEDGDGVTLARFGEDGTIQQRLAHTGAGIIFVLAPDGRTVAYVDVTRGAPSNLHLVGVDGTNDRAITSRNVVGFVWSPDSQQIAYLTVAANGDGNADTGTVAYLEQGQKISLGWHTYQTSTATTRTFGRFVPTAEFLNLLPFFDQYAQSIRLWDRPGQHLVYADDKGVWSLDVATGATTLAGPGELGVWMDR